MTIEARIGIVGGNGWLGNAIASAAVSSGTIDGKNLILSGRSGKRGALEVPGAVHTRDNAELAEKSDIIVLSVRPDDFAGLKIDASGKLVISVMAGIAADDIAARTGARRIVRSIPNAAAAIRRSFTPWFATPDVLDSDKRIVQALFDACGEGAEVPQEAHIDYCVGLTGSGAAFPALLAEAMIAHALSQGLPPDFAARAAKGVVAGASQLFEDRDSDTSAIVQEMIDYRGTTAAALQTMLDNGIKHTVALGLEAAAAKAAALGKPA
ncbi:pyrroline-5-carboxylate reductase family protein [Paracoccus sp. (in: a-proteobacteria)]|uniref:pyrroline-5-carboxylate reductase family protein n=1 Tax=Paracoccus sp. TaxID=267 RepID=UPI002AFF9A73|nr:pyrroline-5-carboxylate reductase dimerization domain-containing protein [Paracoccus sp. (in: a-proteobacteria)]